MDKIRMGIIGFGCRGETLLNTIFACEEAVVTAVCDKYSDRAEDAADRVGKKSPRPAVYLDYKELLADKNVDAVLISTSWDWHIPMAKDAMKAGKIVALEVGGAYDIEDCWDLVHTYEETGTPFMMMENCCFDRFELLVTSLVRAGKFGEIVHCHGTYGHDLRDEILGGRVNRHYRLTNYQKRNCENYPTHELGPAAKILGINRGNSLVSLVSVASKSVGLKEFSKTDKNPDPTLAGAEFLQGDIVNTILTCSGGETITLRLDTTLPRYYSREFTVRGTKGLCNEESNSIFLEDDVDLHEFYETEKTIEKYLNNAAKYAEYLPKEWRNITKEQTELGHGGMDYVMFKAFFKAILNGEEMPVDVYDAATWMSITALSVSSIAAGGAVQSVPDFTRGRWLHRPMKDVVELPGEGNK